MTNEFTTIHTYTRRQAIADGVLVDATATAREAGFNCPFALTAAAWAKYVAVPEGASDQDEAGRLWDVITMLRYAILTNPLSREELRFVLYVVTEAGAEPERVQLKSLCGPDDDGRLCITVMLPDED